jgi:hypothetical protein
MVAQLLTLECAYLEINCWIRFKQKLSLLTLHAGFEDWFLPRVGLGGDVHLSHKIRASSVPKNEHRTEYSPGCRKRRRRLKPS